MDLSEARGLVLFRVVRGGIGITQRLGAIAPCRLQAIVILTLEPERLKNRLATTRKDHRRWKGSSPETLKRLAIFVEVFSLQKLRCRSFDDLEPEMGGFAFEIGDLQFAVLSVVKLRSSVDECHAIAQHAID